MLDEYPRKLRTALASWLILGVGFWGTTATRGQCPATESAKLTASDPAAADGFGVSVAVSGNVAVSGAWHDDDAWPARRPSSRTSRSVMTSPTPPTTTSTMQATTDALSHDALHTNGHSNNSGVAMR